MSTLKADTIQSTGGGAATLTNQQAAKCGSAHGTDAVLDSGFNVSSITDQGTGTFDTNYTNNFSAAINVYSSTRFGTSTIGFTYILSTTTSSHRVDSAGHAGSMQDKPVSSTVHGDLA
tara:strand:+ start:39 stop:392 length:354 start_codon:yes stop_codon:yes gene_type:complete